MSEKFKNKFENNHEYGVIISTSHPVKFKEVVQKAIQYKVKIPLKIRKLYDKKSSKYLLDNNYEDLVSFLQKI